jgi:hypothetical protein
MDNWTILEVRKVEFGNYNQKQDHKPRSSATSSSAIWLAIRKDVDTVSMSDGSVWMKMAEDQLSA